MRGNSDILLGTPDLSQHSTYQVVCPIFDARPPKGNFPGGNFVGAALPKAMQNPYSETDYVRIINLFQAPYYLVNRHYGQHDTDFFNSPGLGKNWVTLVARTKPFSLLSNPSDAQLVESITAFVKLVDGVKGQINPDARKYLAVVTATRAQLFTPETEARIISAVPENDRDLQFWKRRHQPNRMQNLLAEEAPK